jgi:chaperonin GroES
MEINGRFQMAKSELGVRPLHDRILVKRMAEEEKTAGGLIIPDTAKEKPSKGEIVAAGKGRVTEDGKILPLEVKIGDKVLFGKWSGTELKFNGEEYLMMKEEDILGVMN